MTPVSASIREGTYCRPNASQTSPLFVVPLDLCSYHFKYLRRKNAVRSWCIVSTHFCIFKSYTSKLSNRIELISRNYVPVHLLDSVIESRKIESITLKRSLECSFEFRKNLLPEFVALFWGYFKRVFTESRIKRDDTSSEVRLVRMEVYSPVFSPKKRVGEGE